MIDSCSRVDSTAKATRRILLKKSLSLSTLLSHGRALFQNAFQCHSSNRIYLRNARNALALYTLM